MSVFMTMNLFPAFLYVLVETCVAKVFVSQTPHGAEDPAQILLELTLKLKIN